MQLRRCRHLFADWLVLRDATPPSLGPKRRSNRPFLAYTLNIPLYLDKGIRVLKSGPLLFPTPFPTAQALPIPTRECGAPQQKLNLVYFSPSTWHQVGTILVTHNLADGLTDIIKSTRISSVAH